MTANSMHTVRRTSRRRAALALVTVAALIGGVSAAVPASARESSARAKPVNAPAARAAAAAPVGKLTPAGCTQGPSTAACALWAMSGTNLVLGTPIPIWGFSPTGGAGTATAPGPLLVVRQGDVVTVTLHNELAGQAVALAFPGQAASAFSGVGANDTTGIAAGSTRAYTFTASRPGTFSYQAGHTANGARQVAMGLGGALVVLPADGSAYGSAAGMPATTYDDEAVLVLSEIDPAFNADPANFDMRAFRPKYRLINGKAYPSTDPIATDQARKVLLRYVNLGALAHSMSVLGADQVEIAQDGHQMKYQLTVTAESVDAGQTLDTTVVMTSGPESKLAVYEAALHLDNNGQTTGDPLQLATGGMLTFLDTNAPPPSTDGIGPVSSNITVSPNPSDARAVVTVTADLSDATTGGSNVTQAEFVVDDAVTTGVGFGVPMAATFGTVNVTGAHGTIPVTATPCNPAVGPKPVSLNCLTAGKHKIYVRGLDSAGNWGVIGSVIFNLPKTGPQTTGGSVTSSPANGTIPVAFAATGDDSAAGGTINSAEYFVDAVGAVGTGAAMTLNRSATVVAEDATLPAAQINAMTEGVHHIYVRSFDSLALWGPTLDIPIVVDKTAPRVDAASVGPNPTNGIRSDAGNPGYLVISAQITDRDAGNALQSKLTAAEAFLDPANANPTPGTGLQMLPFDGSMNSPLEAVYGLIPVSQARGLTQGTHHVYVRGQDAAGNWGPTFAINLIVDKNPPSFGAITATPNPTGAATNLTVRGSVVDSSPISAAEFWVGALTADPGEGAGTPAGVTVAGTQATVSVPLAGITPGVVTFNVRVMDLAGNWSNVRSVTVTVSKPNLIFKNNFEPSDYAQWATTGGVTNTTTAALPSSREPGSTRGLRVPGSNAAAYVTDNTPTAETTYHARFQFSRNTLTPGPATSQLTIFDGRSSTNANMFQLQFRMNGTVRQLRSVMTRTGAPALTGAWFDITATVHSIRIDWSAATTGSLQVSVDGTVRSTQTGNTSSARVESVRLGVTAGFSPSAAGVAYFDTFESVRYTLP